MSRHILIRDSSSGEEVLLAEARIKSESAIQELVMRTPQLLPAGDFDLGELTVVDCEARLGNGRADLICIDPEGEIAVVEFKRNPENPDSRGVVAQVLEYGAHLWRMSVDDFEQRALAYFASDRCGLDQLKRAKSLAEIFEEPADETGDPDHSEPSELDFRSKLAGNLAVGRFTYIIVTTRVDSSLRKVIEYLNATTSFRVGAVEIDYFANQAQELLVPRSVFPVSRTTNRPQGSRTSRQRFLDSIPEDSRWFFEDLIDSLEDLGELHWGTMVGLWKLRAPSGRMLKLLELFPPTHPKFKRAGYGGIAALLKPREFPAAQGVSDKWRETLETHKGWRVTSYAMWMTIDGRTPRELLDVVVNACRAAHEAMETLNETQD